MTSTTLRNSLSVHTHGCPGVSLKGVPRNGFTLDLIEWVWSGLWKLILRGVPEGRIFGIWPSHFARVNFRMDLGHFWGKNLEAHFARKGSNANELQKSTNTFHPGVHPMYFPRDPATFPANNEKNLRKRSRPMCILSQNGYSDDVWPPDDDRHLPWKRCPRRRKASLSVEGRRKTEEGR